MPKLGAHVDAERASHTYMTLRDLIVQAYGVKPYQITCPDWIAGPRFDILAKLPDGASKDDAPQMLQALLEDRFKLTLHRENKEHPVLALVVGKGGPKLKRSPEAPQAIDENVPLKPGEMNVDSPDGPIRMTVGTGGTATVNMGVRGLVTYKVDPATSTMHMDASGMTMDGFADMLARFSQLLGGNGPQIVNNTNLEGNYEVALDFSLADLMNMVRAAGMTPPVGAASSLPSEAASDPDSSSLSEAVRALGLALDRRNEPVEQLVIDHLEKNPTEN
jgi:uncharacterized protein (TIGR03435 family)